MGLVLEVPVHRATGDPGRLGDLFQGAVGHALFQKQLFCGQQNGAAGLLGLFFGSAHGGVSEWG
ncbi:hypothetical protein D3C78_1979480 [compost metagenome]